MSKYKLKNWTIWIENKSKDTYHYVCDEENLVIVDSNFRKIALLFTI